MDRLVEERDLDATHFGCCGDEDLYPFGCPDCGRLMVFCYECGTLYEDLTDLGRRGTPINHFDPAAPIFHCPGCRMPFGYFFMRDGQHKVTMARWVGAGLGHLLDKGARA
jgi:hypothetical protein